MILVEPMTRPSQARRLRHPFVTSSGATLAGSSCVLRHVRHATSGTSPPSRDSARRGGQAIHIDRQGLTLAVETASFIGAPLDEATRVSGTPPETGSASCSRASG